MKVFKKIEENKIQVSLDQNNTIEEFKEWNNLVVNVLSSLKGQEVSMITLTPQSYSLGYEFEAHQKIARNKETYLLNWGVKLSETNIASIVESEEFQRGLLFIVLSDGLKAIFNAIDNIRPDGTISFINLSVPLILLEDDGKMLTCTLPNTELNNALSGLPI